MGGSVLTRLCLIIQYSHPNMCVQVFGNHMWNYANYIRGGLKGRSHTKSRTDVSLIIVSN